MKKLAALIGVAAALALVPAQASALDLTAGVFPNDEFAALGSSGDPFAVGGGVTGVTRTHFAFAAHLGPKGPSGYAVVTTTVLGGGEAQGHVVCFLNPAPQEAEFGILIEKASGFFTFAEFQFVTFLVLDNGEPSPGAIPDGLSIFAGATPCRTDTPVGGGPVDQGNIVVKG